VIVIAAVAARRPPVVIVVFAVTWRRAAMAVTFEESTPAGWAGAIVIWTSTGRTGVTAKSRAVVVIPIAIAIAGRAVRAAEAAAGPITIAPARRWTIGADIAFDESAFELALEVTFKMPAGRSVGTRTTIGSEAWAAGRRWWHVFMNEFGERYELFLAQFAVAIFIEFGEQFFGLRHFGRTIMAAIGAAAVATMTISVMAIANFVIFFFLAT
jgi:hypothetical protein